MINSINLRAFRDELGKIKMAGLLGSVGKGVKSLAHAGWHGVGPTSTGWGSRIGKGLMVAAPALELPDALAEEDKTGRGRSRAERLSGVATRAAGGLLFGGAVAKATAPLKNPWLATGAGVGANLLYGPAVSRISDAVASAPFAAVKKLRGKPSAPQPPPERPDESWRYQSPAQSPSISEGG